MEERQGTIHDGDRVRLRIVVAGIGRDWVAEHEGFVRNEQFVDRMVSGPVRRWQHTHRFVADGPSRSVVEDEVDYDAPFGPLGELVIRRALPRLFAFRRRRTLGDLVRQSPFVGRPPMRIAVTGATGTIGRDLVPFLTTAGHAVERLADGELDAERLEGVDAVVHLAGGSTLLLSETLAGLRRPPRLLVSTSSVNGFGERGDAAVDEDTPASDAGIRVVNLRCGIVLSARGGALATMLRPFRLGLGGTIGDGDRQVNWIAIDDLVGAIYQALHDERLNGPINALAPNPVTSRELAQTLGRVLRRPAVVPMPDSAVGPLLGKAGRELLSTSGRATPDGLDRVGFRFDFPTLEDTLRFQLGRA